MRLVFAVIASLAVGGCAVWLAQALVGLAAFSSPGRLALLLGPVQAQSAGLSAPQCGDDMFLAWFGVIVLACPIWVVLDV